MPSAPPSTPPDLEALKLRQQRTWASGDYAAVGSSLVLMAELLAEALDLRGGSSVLDVAAGNGNASLAAARRGCRVTSTDFVPALLDRGRQRAEAEGYRITFQHADAENLPFPDASFAIVLSTVGVMFAPNHSRTASEMLRVCRPGGKIGLASWTPDSFVGQIFRLIGRYLPPPPGLSPPSLWGTRDHLQALFPSCTLQATARDFVFRSLSPAAWLAHFRAFYGPMLQTMNALDPAAQEALSADLLTLVASLNRADDGTMVVPSQYLEAVLTKP